MAHVYKHIAGDATGSVDYKIITNRRILNSPEHNITLFLLSNTGSDKATVDIYLKRPIITVTKRDVNDKPIETVDNSEIYYVLKNLDVPSGVSYNVLEGIPNFKYTTYFELYIKVAGDATKTLDLILNYE